MMSPEFYLDRLDTTLKDLAAFLRSRLKEKPPEHAALQPCNEPCPKCGSSDIHRQYFGEGEERDVKREPQYLHPGFFKILNFRPMAIKPCIVHHCRVCQFEWAGEPLREST